MGNKKPQDKRNVAVKFYSWCIVCWHSIVVDVLWEKVKNFPREIKRVSFELFMWVVLFMLLKDQALMDKFTPVVQLLLFKAILVNMGVLHAHLARKLLFPKIDWSTDDAKFNKIVAITFYIMFIFAYTRGG